MLPQWIIPAGQLYMSIDFCLRITHAHLCWFHRARRWRRIHWLCKDAKKECRRTAVWSVPLLEACSSLKLAICLLKETKQYWTSGPVRLLWQVNYYRHLILLKTTLARDYHMLIVQFSKGEDQQWKTSCKSQVWTWQWNLTTSM